MPHRPEDTEEKHAPAEASGVERSPGDERGLPERAEEREHDVRAHERADRPAVPEPPERSGAV